MPHAKVQRDKDGFFYEVEGDPLNPTVEVWWEKMDPKGKETLLFIRQEALAADMGIQADVLTLNDDMVYGLIDALNRAMGLAENDHG